MTDRSWATIRGLSRFVTPGAGSILSLWSPCMFLRLSHSHQTVRRLRSTLNMDKRKSLVIYEDDAGVQMTKEDGPRPRPRSAPPSLSQIGSADTVVSWPGDSPPSKQDSDAQYVTGYKLAGLVMGMTVAVFLIYLDNSIISTATPVITADLHETADIGWYAGAYTLVS